MKIKILFSILIFINAIFIIYSGKINEEKSFDEIFGQRWDEKEEENGIIGQTDDQNEANYDENISQFDQIFDENLEMKEEIATNYDQLEQLKNCDHFSNAIDKKKREIVEKFGKIKNKIKQKEKKYSTKEWNYIEIKIAQKLGVNREKIYEWKKEFGLIKNKYSDDEKRKILKRFDQINEKLNEKLEGKRKICQKIIAKHLGIDLSTIFKWKKQLNGKPMKNQKTDEKKREIIEKYLKIKSEFMQLGKHSQKEWKEFRAKIKQMFGVNYNTIKRWAKKLKINQNISKERKMLTIAEKMEKIKQYYQIKEQNPNLSDVKIAKILNIPTSSLRQYKAKFGN